MRRLAGPLAAGLLASSCSLAPPPAAVTQPAPAPASAAAAPAVCRIGPDGGRPAATQQAPAPRRVADRGIGGTGGPAQAVRTADRGIGGTGIIAVITGFASICLGGDEVAVDDTTPATQDGAPSRIGALRAGELAIVTAAGPPGALFAQSVAVRHEVIGPVEQFGPDGLRVAGQTVVLGAGVAGQTHPAIGSWVAVSGLQRPDGSIEATRIDPAPAGPVLVHGELKRSLGGAMIGSLPVQLPDGSAAPAGWQVTAAGRLAGGVLVADSVVRDRLADDPAAVFGPNVQQFVVEGYVSSVTGGLLLNRSFLDGNGASGGQPQRAVATFRRAAGGGLGAATVRPATGASFGADAGSRDTRAFSPAPVSRAGLSDGGRGFGGPGSAGQGFGGQGLGSQGSGVQSSGGSGPFGFGARDGANAGGGPGGGGGGGGGGRAPH